MGLLLFQRTDEYIGKQDPSPSDATPRKKTRAKSLQIDPQLEEDWKHVVNQINNLLSSQDEPITVLPFSVTLDSANKLVDLFSVGCYFEASHSLYKWLSTLLCPV